VNTVRVQDGRWLGHNTDSGGILTVLSQAYSQAGGGQGPAPRGVVLGAGGSARAAVDALLRWEVPRIEVWNRSRQGRERLRQWLQGRGLADRVRIGGLPSENPPADTQSSVYVCCLAGEVLCRGYLPDAAGAETSLLLDLRYGDQRPAEEAPLGFGFSDGLPVLMMQGGPLWITTCNSRLTSRIGVGTRHGPAFVCSFFLAFAVAPGTSGAGILRALWSAQRGGALVAPGAGAAPSLRAGRSPSMPGVLG
ncbi:hypothetical protein CSA17_06845, partial [bacterium DOLJORAL78_65_58]